MICFENILGNKMTAQCLENAAMSGRTPHSYIIDGNEGTGRKYIAKCFAKSLLCTKGKTGNCSCSSCTSFENMNNPDVIFIRLPQGRKTIGIEQIREEVIRQAAVKPFLYKYKIFIICDADKMTAEAQNSMLKTLEEPEASCKFILITENFNNLLPTIISRCVLFRLKPLSGADIKKYLEKKGIKGYEADIISEYAQGSLKKAENMAESNEFFEAENKASKLMVDIENIEKGNTEQLYKQFDALEDMKDSIDEVLNISMGIYVDIIKYKAFGDEKRIHHKNKINDIKYIAGRIRLKKAVDRFEILFRTSLKLKQNANYSMAIEVMLFEMKKNTD